MKKAVLCLVILILCLTAAFACGGHKRYDLTEETFFLVMTNMQYYPEQYVGKTVTYDCFTYRLTDVDGQEYMCGVRKCSSGYGCNCGKDTIIGFVLNYDGVIPEPVNQSEDTADKTWIHVEGTLASAQKREIRIYAYQGDQIDYSTVETVVFYDFDVAALSLIEDASGLAYYVTK